MSMLEKINRDKFEAVRNGALKKALVFFKSAGCPNCRRLAPIVEALAAEDAKGIFFGYVDISEDADLAIEMGILSVPTIVIFEAGKERARFSGVVSRDKLREALGISP